MARCYEFQQLNKKICGRSYLRKGLLDKSKTYLDYLMASDYSDRTKRIYAHNYKFLTGNGTRDILDFN